MLNEYGGPDVLSLEDRPCPAPAAGEVLVKVDTVGVGKPDVLFRTGSYPWAPPLPLVIGNEMAGTIVAVGEGVRGLSVGQPVHALKTDGGCCAEFVAVPSGIVTPLPDGGSMERSVGALNFLLAHCLLHEAGKVTPGQSLYINGAAGGVGIAIIQMAKRAGMRVIAGCSTDEKCAFAIAHGADGAVNYRSDGVEQAVQDFTDDRGVDLILDQYVGAGFLRNFEMLAPLGQVIIYNWVGGMPPADTAAAMTAFISKCPAIRWFSLHYLDAQADRRTAILGQMIELITSGMVGNPIFARLPLAQAAEAHRLLDAGAVLGKLLLKPQHAGVPA
ncbi:MAG: zinc-binding dehydrogenase [Lysobacter sp.]|nr:zinc-binding dehydrogenase [Lysobacter sp.]